MTNTVTLLLREAQKHVDRGDDCGSLARIVVEVLTATSPLDRGAIAYQLTKRLVIDMPTARAAVDAAWQAAIAAKDGS